MSVERAREQLELAEGRWLSAIKAHAQPPPDTGYARRLRALADAATQEQAAYRYADEQGYGWRPGPAWLPPQELRDAPWRSSLAPNDVWERFDEAVETLSHARTGVSVVAIAQAFGQLSAAAWDLAEALAQAQRRRPLGLAKKRRAADAPSRAWGRASDASQHLARAGPHADLPRSERASALPTKRPRRRWSTIAIVRKHPPAPALGYDSSWAAAAAAARRCRPTARLRRSPLWPTHSRVPSSRHARIPLMLLVRPLE